MKPARIALLGMICESNRIARPAGREDFHSLYWLQGDALLCEARKPESLIAPEVCAFVAAMDATGPWEPVPVALAASHPAGPVERDVLEDFRSAVAAGLRQAGPLDGVLIANHGAMVAEHLHDPDGAIAADVRAIVGKKVRIVMTLDLHANLSDLMVDSTDLIVGYRTNPHVDMIERGEEAAFALRRMLAGAADPKAVHVKLPLCPASVSLLTASGPYGAMIDYGQRRQAEAAGAILNVSVFGNFVFSDVPENGLSVLVTARSDRRVAKALAEEIADYGWARRTDFVKQLTPLADAVTLARETDREPVIFSDAGDNPGGGGSGRTTELLQALIDTDADDVLYGSFHDPELARQACDAGPGATIEAVFNRTSDAAPWTRWDVALSCPARVVAVHDGHVTGRLGLFQGRRMDLGPSAALAIGGITVIVISDRTQTADPVFFEMFGLDIAEARTVVVKSRGHFRAGFRPWFPPDRVYEVDTGGLTSPVLERYDFKHLPQPSFPLDGEVGWASGNE
ncbi:MAG: M81 family metallopeptidase [Pseudomonadota bacterium]